MRPSGGRRAREVRRGCPRGAQGRGAPLLCRSGAESGHGRLQRQVARLRAHPRRESRHHRPAGARAGVVHQEASEAALGLERPGVQRRACQGRRDHFPARGERCCGRVRQNPLPQGVRARRADNALQARHPPWPGVHGGCSRRHRGRGRCPRAPQGGGARRRPGWISPAGRLSRGALLSGIFPAGGGNGPAGLGRGGCTLLVGAPFDRAAGAEPSAAHGAAGGSPLGTAEQREHDQGQVVPAAGELEVPKIAGAGTGHLPPNVAAHGCQRGRGGAAKEECKHQRLRVGGGARGRRRRGLQASKKEPHEKGLQAVPLSPPPEHRDHRIRRGRSAGPALPRKLRAPQEHRGGWRPPGAATAREFGTPEERPRPPIPGGDGPGYGGSAAPRAELAGAGEDAGDRSRGQRAAHASSQQARRGPEEHILQLHHGGSGARSRLHHELHSVPHGNERQQGRAAPDPHRLHFHELQARARRWQLGRARPHPRRVGGSDHSRGRSILRGPNISGVEGAGGKGGGGCGRRGEGICARVRPGALHPPRAAACEPLRRQQRGQRGLRGCMGPRWQRDLARAPGRGI
mmetsp:Transcript_13009/g.41083  ORF Transcript_13009/g.41083 Transcript_13009/m.41083 type:complete len:574 (+) Transcript_13009:990-2711(+)